MAWPEAVGRKARQGTAKRGVPAGFPLPGGLLLRWQTRFGRWVKSYGATRLAQELGLSCGPGGPITIYQWVGGTRTPRPASALRIVTLARGKVRLDDVYAHRYQVRPPPP